MEYEASKSSTRAETVLDFLESYDPNMSIEDVPGIGPASAKELKVHGYGTVQSLLGLYLIGVQEDSTSTSACQLYYKKLKEVCNANCHTITFSIAHLADQKNLFEY